MKKHIASRLRENEEIKYCEPVTALLGTKSRECYLTIVFNKSSEFDLALFLFRPSRMFMINNKIELITVFPMTSELNLIHRGISFSFQWLDYHETRYDVKPKDLLLYTFLLNHVHEASVYQREPFHAGSPTHQWIWYYQESIPAKIKELRPDLESIFKTRASVKFQPEHFGKEIMTSYIKQQLKKREIEYLVSGELSVFVGSWNCAGTEPSENLAKWLMMNEEVLNEKCDVIILCLQEICELSAMNILGDENREELWVAFLKEQMQVVFPNVSYKIVKCNQISSQALVGLLSVLFIKDSLKLNIQNFSVNQVKLGLKGYTGNKGAISLRFEYLNSSFCIINCHLAAHKSKVKNRNENVHSVLKQAKFTVHGREMKIYEHDYVIWVGDLNYRIQGLDSSELRKFIQMEEFKTLLKYDQLINQKRTENILFDFNEADINFPPTYKYTKGSSEYTYCINSDKREPSWCDRILCRGPAVYKKYESCQDILQSDHKPIFALLEVPVKLVRDETKKKVKLEIISEINSIYQNAYDSVEYSTDAIIFENVFYKKTYKQSLIIRNKGNHMLLFSVLSSQEPWFEINHDSGKIMPKETFQLEFSVCVSEKIVSKANYTNEFLNCEIIINVNKGIIKSIPLTVDFKCSCFGSCFEHLVKILGPISLIPCNVKEMAEKSECSLDVPKELYSLVDLIKRDESNLEYIFEHPSDPLEVEAIRTYLDTLMNPDIPVSIQSLWRVLIELLEVLPRPLISAEVLETLFEENVRLDDGRLKLRLIEKINPVKGRCVAFLLDLCNYIYNKANAVIDELVEEIMYPMLKMKRNSKDKKYEAKRKLYFRIMITE